jgi:hypothetical protein
MSKNIHVDEPLEATPDAILEQIGDCKRSAIGFLLDEYVIAPDKEKFVEALITALVSKC